jgi:Ca-activated chloride channel family protein
MRSLAAAFVACLVAVAAAPARADAPEDPGHPALLRVAADGTRSELPLVRADVRAAVRGPIAQVVLVQRFANPSPEPIEAVYVFPMPHDAAVGGMTMQIGARRIRAVIKTRQDARTAYDQAKQDGKAAALLEQERPNIFTQSVANILPGEQIDVELTYDVLLEPTDGAYELALPTVVGPRYIPGAALVAPNAGGGWSADTDRVPDASRITPPVAAPGHSTGNTVGVDLDIDAGLPILELTSPTHRIVDVEQPDGHHRVTLADGEMTATKDLVVRWRVQAPATAVAVLADRSGPTGHVALVIEPPPPAASVAAEPRELVFVVDTSGSMSGEPLAIVKRGLRHALGELDPNDAFRILNFANDVDGFRGGAVLPATRGNVRDALSWVNGLESAGGTEMITGIRAALPGRPAGDRTRYVVFMTDGFIGNEDDILSAIRTLRDDRTHLFSFGVGSSVNRYLLHEMAQAGDGVASILLLDEDPVIRIDRFFDQVARPVLSRIRVEWDGVAVEDTTPGALGALFAGRPIVVAGRYAKGGRGTVRVHGEVAGAPVVLSLPVSLPDGPASGDVIGRLWARQRIAELAREPDGGPSVIERLGLAYSIATAYTSFVAVEERPRVRTPGETVQVPVDLPEGVTAQAVGTVLTQGYTINIGVGRTFGGALGAAAASQGDGGVSFSGASSVENGYYVDGINTTGLPYGRLHGGGLTMDRVRLSLDALVGRDVRGDRTAVGVAPSLEVRFAGGFAAGATANILRIDDSTMTTVLATIARWALWRALDLRFGFGLAFAHDRSGAAWQLRLAVPLPLGRDLHPELGVHVDGADVGDDDLLSGSLGIGVRF